MLWRQLGRFSLDICPHKPLVLGMTFPLIHFCPILGVVSIPNGLLKKSQ